MNLGKSEIPLSLLTPKKLNNFFDFFKFLKNSIYNVGYKNYADFLRIKAEHIERILSKEDSAVLEKRGQEMFLKLYNEASSKVPAYKNFLDSEKIDPRKINSPEDLKLLPITSKKNYLNNYALKDLNWDGRLTHLHLISVSSGSTGEPFFWPRGLGLEFETSLEYELAMKNFFQADKKKTLFIIGYAMGMYVAGVFTLNSMMDMAKKGYPITIVSPGADKDSILKILKNVGSNFDQVIIAAYSPVLKDIIDKGVEEKLPWEEYHLKFISGGEGFSEEFRSYIYKKIKLPSSDYLTSSMNTYGSADAAILGHETPLSILIRKLSSKDQRLRKALFKEDRVPSLHQYYPFFKYFEEVEGDLVFSTFGGIPLIRYSIGDNGGIIPFEKMISILEKHGYDIKKELTKYNAENLVWKLPFVYLFGRKDNTRIFYGANIYPEHIKNCLEQDAIIDQVTGKYFMDILFDKKHNQKLYLAIELGQKIKPNSKLKKQIASIIDSNLVQINDEYKYLSHTIGNRIYPTVELFSHGDPKYFSPSIKPRYVKKL